MHRLQILGSLIEGTGRRCFPWADNCLKTLVQVSPTIMLPICSAIA